MDLPSTSGGQQPDFDEVNFKWTPALEAKLLSLLIHYKPFGVNKFFNLLFVRDRLSEHFNMDIRIHWIWTYLISKWDLEDDADSLITLDADIFTKCFTLPEEYLIEVEEMKKKRMKDGANHDETNKVKLSSDPNQARSSSVSADSKDNLIEIGLSSNKVNEVGPKEIPSVRRSVRMRRKPKKILEDLNEKTNKPRMNNKTNKKKVIASKQKIKNAQNQFKDLVINNEVSNVKSGKKQKCKNDLTDLNIPGCSFRLDTPEKLIGKASKRSVTLETRRKIKVLSSNKDQKSKLSLQKASTKFSINDMNFQEEKIEHFKTEKSNESMMESTSTSFVPNKN